MEPSSLPPCYVVVRKLSLADVSRMSINPLHVKRKCGRCKKHVVWGPRCTSCASLYHFTCGTQRRECCGLRLEPLAAPTTAASCPRCKGLVQYGPQCSVCRSRFHSRCVSPHETCCQLNLCETRRSSSKCGQCMGAVEFGPKCPLCLKMYHAACLVDTFSCCGVQFTSDEDTNYRCRRCRKKLSLMAPMCLLCGRAVHGYCLSVAKNCCGRRVPLEVYLVPSFQFVANYYKQFDRKRAMLRKLEEIVAGHGGKTRATSRALSLWRGKKSVSSQTTAESHCQTSSCLETLTIVDVKTEVLEEKEVDIEDSEPPPVLEREDSFSPEPSSSMQMPDITDSDDSLKNLFDFLYKMVKRFPPQVQTQVKIELFKVVTEAEMRCETSFNSS